MQTEKNPAAQALGKLGGKGCSAKKRASILANLAKAHERKKQLAIDKQSALQ